MKKREIIIDGQNSDWYEKAIFILKNNSEEKRPESLFRYAEELIENSMKKGIVETKGRPVKKQWQLNRIVDIIFYVGIGTFLLSLMLLLL